jgi:hypothetical protein
MSRAIINARPMIIPHPTWRTARQRPTFHLDFKQGHVDVRAGNLGTFSRNLVKNVWNGSQYVSVAVNTPGLQRDPATGLWGCLHEPAATSQTRQSASLNVSPWSQTAVTVTTATETSPFGSSTVSTITESATIDSQFCSQSTAQANIANTAYTLSAIAKLGQGSRFLALLLPADVFGVTRVVTFNLVTGVIAGSNDAGNIARIENLGGGWYRCRTTATTTASPNSFSGPQIRVADAADNFTVAYQGNGASSIKVAHVQYEVGPVATSPIITTGSAVTRPADVWRWDGAQLTSWFNPGQGTFYAESAPGSNTVRTVSLIASESDISERIEMRVVSNRSRSDAWVNNAEISVNNFSLETFAAYPVRYKHALTYSGSNLTNTLGGTTSTTALTRAPINLGSMFLGSFRTNSNHLNGLIHEITYWPSVLSEGRLHSLVPAS